MRMRRVICTLCFREWLTPSTDEWVTCRSCGRRSGTEAFVSIDLARGPKVAQEAVLYSPWARPTVYGIVGAGDAYAHYSTN